MLTEIIETMTNLVTNSRSNGAEVNVSVSIELCNVIDLCNIIHKYTCDNVECVFDNL